MDANLQPLMQQKYVAYVWRTKKGRRRGGGGGGGRRKARGGWVEGERKREQVEGMEEFVRGGEKPSRDNGGKAAEAGNEGEVDSKGAWDGSRTERERESWRYVKTVRV